MKNSDLSTLIGDLWRMSGQPVPAYVPLLIWGEAGIGKSDTVKQAAAELDIDIVDLRLGNLEAPDLMGLMRDEEVGPCMFHVEAGEVDPIKGGERFTPAGLWHHVRLHHKDQIPKKFAADPVGFVAYNKLRLTQLGYGSLFENRTVYSAPAWFPAPDSAGIVFLDEMNRSQRETRQGVFQLVLDRRIHEFELPPRWIVVSANNPSTSTSVEGMQTYADVDSEMEEDKAFMSRFLHVTLDSSATEWSVWAKGAGIEPSIRALLDPANSSDDRVRKLLGLHGVILPVLEPTPRGWAALGRILPSVISSIGAPSRNPWAPSLVNEVIRGLVGEKGYTREGTEVFVASKFIEFLGKTAEGTGQHLHWSPSAEEQYLEMERVVDLVRNADPLAVETLAWLRGELPDDLLSELDSAIADVAPSLQSPVTSLQPPSASEP